MWLEEIKQWNSKGGVVGGTTRGQMAGDRQTLISLEHKCFAGGTNEVLWRHRGGLC